MHKESVHGRGRLFKAQKESEKADLDSLLREKLTERGYTAKELKTLMRTGRYSFAVEERQEIDKLSFIKGRWIKTETEILKEMLQNRVHPRITADRLGRKKASVQAKIAYLAKHVQKGNEAPPYKMPQALSPELEDSIFHSRLTALSKLETWYGPWSSGPCLSMAFDICLRLVFIVIPFIMVVADEAPCAPCDFLSLHSFCFQGLGSVVAIPCATHELNMAPNCHHGTSFIARE